jgi:hypothetical protein
MNIGKETPLTIQMRVDHAAQFGVTIEKKNDP